MKSPIHEFKFKKNFQMSKKIFLISAAFVLSTLSSFAVTQTVQVANYSFTPSNFTINLGDTVKWIWVSGSHTTTSTTIPVGATAWSATISPNITIYTYVPSMVGTYNYKCNVHPTMIASFVVACPTNQLYITNPVPITVCSGGTVLLTSAIFGGGAPFAYQWQSSPTGTTWTNIAGATNSSYAATVTTGTSTMYRVISTNSCGNSSVSSNTATVTLVNISIAVSPLQSSVCAGGCVTLLAQFTNGGAPNGSWTWSPSTGLNTTTGQTVIACPGATTGYTVTFVSTNGCSATAPAYVSVNSPSVLTETHVNPSCGNNNGSINLSASGTSALTYAWSNGATTQDLSGLGAGTFSVTVTTSAGCTSTLSVTLTSNNSMVVSITVANATCPPGNNGYAVSSVSGGTAPYTYIWNNGVTAYGQTGLAPGTYSVTVYDANQCSATATAIVQQTTVAPTVSITSGSASFCAGGHATLSVSPLGLSYQWKKGNTTITGATNSTYNATVSGTFKCVVTYSCGVVTSNGIVITKLSTPTAVVTAGGPTTFCAGSNVVLTVNAQAGCTYQWKKANVNVAGATNTSYTATTAANYKCVVTNTSTGCSKTSNTITVTVNCRNEDVTGNSTFSLYPNPFATELSIDLKTVSTVIVYNVLGQKVDELTEVNGLVKTGSSFSAGMYLLVIKQNGEVISTQRIVKEGEYFLIKIILRKPLRKY